MKSNISLIIVLLCLLFPTSIYAQDMEEEVEYETRGVGEHAFIIDAQVRARGEYRNGAVVPRGEADKAAMFVNERTRLGIGYASDGIQLQFSGQHAGVWGIQGINGSSDGFSINTAWGQINTNNRLFSARVGRQTLSYDNERIIGANDWSAPGNSHNALRLAYEDEWHKLHILGAINRSEERVNGNFYNDTITNLYKNMQTLWYHFGNISYPIQGSLLLMNIGRETGVEGAPKTNYLQTMGVFVTYDTYHLGATVEGYYQMGKEVNDDKTSAWMAAVDFRYTLNNEWTFNLGYDYLSGSEATDKKNHSFCPLYGSFHSFHGAMDYFTSSYFQPFHEGLSDIHAGCKWNAYKDVSVSGSYHFLSTSSDMVQLSHEADFTANWQIKKDVTLNLGYSFAINSKNMNRLLGGSNKKWQSFCFLQLNISPRVLFHTW